jgi:hypothetical protein
VIGAGISVIDIVFLIAWSVIFRFIPRKESLRPFLRRGRMALVVCARRNSLG